MSDLFLRLCAATAAAAILALAAPPARSAELESAAGRSRPTTLAVWAFADGDTPLGRARVRVWDRRGRPIRQIGRGRTRTHTTGVQLLQFRKLPRRFTVEVTPRRRAHGPFRAVVKRYRSGRVVHVTPVTTLAAELALRRRRPTRLAIARRQAYRLLRIPGWHEDHDLRHSDRYFDGEVYLRAARRAGGVEALNRALVRRALEGKHRSFRNRNRNRPARLASTDWRKLLGNPSALIEELFTSVVTFAGKTAVEVSAAKAGDTALGWLLELFGAGGDELTKEDLDQIRAAIDAVGRQVTELKGDVAAVGYVTVEHDTDPILADINTASEQLAHLANAPAGGDAESRAQRKNYADDISDFIKKNLIPAPGRLDQILAGDVPLSRNLLQLASINVHKNTRFFDRRSSEQVAAVYYYFAGYQAKLSILLAEYYHYRPDTFSPSDTDEKIRRIEDNVSRQATLLKPPVPENTVIDTRTGLMWMQAIDGSPTRATSDVGEIYLSYSDPCRAGGCYRFRLTAAATSTRIPGLAFANWAMPSADDLRTLLSDRGGDGVDYLVSEAGVTRRLLETVGWHVWISDGFSLDTNVLSFWLFDLKNGAVAPLNRILIGDVYRSDFPNWRRYLATQAHGILYRRVVAPGEEYWWR